MHIALPLRRPAPAVPLDVKGGEAWRKELRSFDVLCATGDVDGCRAAIDVATRRRHGATGAAARADSVAG